MLIVLTVVFLISCIVSIVIEQEEIGVGSFILFGASLIIEIVMIVQVQGISVIDDRIAMYQEENEVIENQISAAIASYEGYESATLMGLVPEESIFMIVGYPELKSDALVEKQIEVYMENNNTIKELKDKKIQGGIVKWWCYFGK